MRKTHLSKLMFRSRLLINPSCISLRFVVQVPFDLSSGLSAVSYYQFVSRKHIGLSAGLRMRRSTCKAIQDQANRLLVSKHGIVQGSIILFRPLEI